MAKRLSEKQKKIIVKCFIEDRAVDALAEEYDCTKSTIIRNLKKILGDEKYKEVIDKSKKIKHTINSEKINHSLEEDNFIKEDFSSISPFTEIAPLNFEIESSVQKDLSSVPIHEVNLPSIVYMIVDKEIELEVKYLKEYPDWQFLAKDELNRKTIAIYSNLKVATLQKLGCTFCIICQHPSSFKSRQRHPKCADLTAKYGLCWVAVAPLGLDGSLKESKLSQSPYGQLLDHF